MNSVWFSQAGISCGLRKERRKPFPEVDVKIYLSFSAMLLNSHRQHMGFVYMNDGGFVSGCFLFG